MTRLASPVRRSLRQDPTVSASTHAATGNFLSKVRASRARNPCAKFNGFDLLRCRGCSLVARNNATAHRTFFANQTSESAGIYVGNGDGILFKPETRSGLAAAPIAESLRGLADHQTRRPYLIGFEVFGINPGVAYLRVGEGDNLTPVRWVCEDFLVTGHRRIEYHLPHRGATDANGASAKDATILKN